MIRETSKAAAWRRQHGGKRLHRKAEPARVHAGKLNKRGKATVWAAYPCTWGDHPDAPEATEHWHVGRL